MVDVFVSYKSSDRPRAEMLASWIEALGVSVWIDRKIELSEAWKHKLEAELRGARLVVVLWGADALRSAWIRHEAEIALSEGKLLQVHATGLPLEEPFSGLQAVRMQAWSGEKFHSERLKLLTAIADRLGVAVPDSLRVQPEEMAPRLDYNLAEAMQLAFFYCARALEWRQELIGVRRESPPGHNSMGDAFNAMMTLLAVPAGPNGEDREGIMHRMVQDFQEELDRLAPLN